MQPQFRHVALVGKHHESVTGAVVDSVRDVALAYVALLERGEAGQAYNVASGHGIALAELLARLAALLGMDVVPQPSAALVRASDIAHLVGDAARLRAATGWSPRITLDQTLRDVVDAEAN